MNFIDDHAWMRLLELLLNDFGLRRKSIFICLVLIIGTRDYFFDPLSNPDNLSDTISTIPDRNLFTTVSGWWWNSKKRQGFLNRPMARDVSNFSTIGNSIILFRLSEVMDVLSDFWFKYAKAITSIRLMR